MTYPTGNTLQNTDTPSDETLARRVQSGCVRSYEELDRRLRPRLIYLLYKRCGHREDAEDLAQQTLIKAYQQIGRYSPSRSFRAWLFTIGIRLAIDAYRRRTAPDSGERVEGAADPRPGPAEQLSSMETQRRLWAIADRVLEPTQRTALWLHYGEQLKAGDIAKALGLSAMHVRVLLYRARRALMVHLENEVDEPAGTPAVKPGKPQPAAARRVGRRVREGVLS